MDKHTAHRNDLIQGYIDAELTTGQWAEIERLLSDDPEFADELEAARFVRQQEKQVLRSTLENSGGRFRFKWPYAAAAVILVLLLIKVYPSEPTLQVQVDEWILAEHPSPIVQLSDDHHSTEWVQAVEYYQDGDYVTFLSYMHKHFEEKVMTEEMMFYTALSDLRTGAFTKALKRFENLVDRSPIYKEEAQWYSILALGKQGLWDEALDVIQTLDDGHFRATQAEALAERIREM